MARKILVVFACVFVFLTVLGLVSGNRGKIIEREQRTDKKKGELVVEKFDFATSKLGNVTLVGTVKNETAKQYKYAQVQFNLYDKDGAQVGSTMANVNNLEPGGRWKFEAVVLQSNVTEARLKGVTGF